MTSTERPTTPTEPARPDAPGVAWHALPAEVVLDRLGTGATGLDPPEVDRRLAEHGPNRLPDAGRDSALRRLARQLDDVLIYSLLAAAVVTGLLGEWVDTGVILGVVVINAVIGYVQEGRAEQALEAIRAMLTLRAHVVRGGTRAQIPAEDLVPGDVVLLESGDRVPADLRVLEATSLHVEEAMLTGESVPVRKSARPVDDDADLGDRRSMLYSGTAVTRGQGRGVVVGTGTDTEIGRIGTLLSGVETLTTPLLRSIDRFGKVLAAAIVALGAATFAFASLTRDYPVHELFLIVVGIVVAAIPEGLPAVMTITLALGVQRMARRNAIIRRLPAVETLGAVTVICSDKTGTLTRNEMTAVRIVTAGQTIDVTGSGYAPHGRFHAGGEELHPGTHPHLTRIGTAAIAASDAELHQGEGGDWHLEGDPTEGALVVLGEKTGQRWHDVRRAHRRIDVIPFESDAKYMAALVEADGRRTAFVKGAPERVLGFCASQREGPGVAPLDRSWWDRAVTDLAGEGFRVMAVAERAHDADTLEAADVESGLTLLGLVAMADPPREEALDAVAECRTAGVDVKVITGDHALTAGAVALLLGIGSGKQVLTGADLERLSDAELEEAVHHHDVYARTTPEHKLRLVRALQAGGAVAAMTGDGSNDAPALKRADVGVAMGVKGSEASKDASDMVLADDNFATIARAVHEGRTTYDNLRKAITFILPTNGAEALVVVGAVLLAFDTLPITPVQILWVNMVTAVTLALALAFEPAETGVMRRPPRDPAESILDRRLVGRVALVSVVIAAGAIVLFRVLLDGGAGVAVAQTAAVNVVVAAEVFYLFGCRSFTAPALSRRGLLGNRAALVATAVLVLLQLAMTYVPVMNVLFGTAPIGPATWGWVLLSGAVVLVVVELEKAVRRRRSPAGSAPAAEPLGEHREGGRSGG